MKNALKILGLFALVALAVAACGKNDDKKESIKRELGKYVYTDDNGILHVDADCYRLRRGKDDNGHDIYAKHLIDTAELKIVNKNYFRVCTKCVNDKLYERLLEISDRNLQNENDWEDVNEDGLDGNDLNY